MNKNNNVPDSSSLPNAIGLKIACGLCLFSVLLWLPAIYIPWWGDDYFFLLSAQRARLHNDPWWLPFWPAVPSGFWRPLSVDSYWRFVEGTLQANLFLAHLCSLVLLIISSAAVGLMGVTLARALHWQKPLLIGLFSAALFSLSDVHFLAVHWVAAANSSFIVLWVALAMSAWVVLPSAKKNTLIFLCAIIPLLQILALFSKESGILLPLLFGVISLFCWNTIKLHRYQFISWCACVVVCIIWLCFFKKFTSARDHGYDLMIGANVLRNILSLIAWFLNIPREALRFLLSDQKLIGCIWTLAAALPMSLFLYMTGQKLLRVLSGFQCIVVLVFIVCAYAPYFLLASQSYEYYAAVAIIFPMILCARSVLLISRPYIAIGFFCLSSVVSIQGSRMISDPGLIGRAMWAERQFEFLSKEKISIPLVIEVSNAHQFYAMGTAGLAWRLSIEENKILVADGCIKESSRILMQNEKGNFEWKNCF